MKDTTLLMTGIAGTATTMLCCATPVLTVLLGAIGLSTWLGWADYVLLPALLMFIGVTAVGFYRRRRGKRDAACCDAETARLHEVQR